MGVKLLTIAMMAFTTLGFAAEKHSNVSRTGHPLNQGYSWRATESRVYFQFEGRKGEVPLHKAEIEGRLDELVGSDTPNGLRIRELVLNAQIGKLETKIEDYPALQLNLDQLLDELATVQAQMPIAETFLGYLYDMDLPVNVDMQPDGTLSNSALEPVVPYFQNLHQALVVLELEEKRARLLKELDGERIQQIKKSDLQSMNNYLDSFSTTRKKRGLKTAGAMYELADTLLEEENTTSARNTDIIYNNYRSRKAQLESSFPDLRPAELTSADIPIELKKHAQSLFSDEDRQRFLDILLLTRKGDWVKVRILLYNDYSLSQKDAALFVEECIQKLEDTALPRVRPYFEWRGDDQPPNSERLWKYIRLFSLTAKP